MSRDSKLIVINHESIFENESGFYCDNIASRSLPEGLSKNFDLLMIARKSKIYRSQKIDLNQIKLSSNIFSFLLSVFQTFKIKKKKYLIISITPYTFLAYLLLFIFRKNIYVYLRSNGYEEYKYFLRFFGPFIYHIMFTIVSWKAKLIVCRDHLLNGKSGETVFPSELNKRWLLSRKKPNLNKVELLYVGRIKVEKGVFSLLKIFDKLNKKDSKLSIVSSSKTSHKINQKNVEVIHFENKNDEIIEVYDSHNIFILPSFTEAHPQVLDESLCRLRPVIIFDEISHVVGNRKGVFVSKRDPLSLSQTIDYIMENYNSIEEKIIKNVLPTKEFFLNQMTNIIKGN